MGNKLYVGNLAFSVNDQTLEELFAPKGSVQSAKVIIDKVSGRSKGFGFVEMATDEEAQGAAKDLNGHQLSGRALSVSEAKPQAPRENRGFGARSNFGGGANRSYGRGY